VTARRVPTIAYLGTHITERCVVFLGGSARLALPSGPTRDLAPRDLVSGPSGRAKHGCRPLRWLRRARALTGKLLHAVMSGAASRDPALLRRRANQICSSRVTVPGSAQCVFLRTVNLTRKPNTIRDGLRKPSLDPSSEVCRVVFRPCQCRARSPRLAAPEHHPTVGPGALWKGGRLGLPGGSRRRPVRGHHG